jgi:hypothetical protein
MTYIAANSSPDGVSKVNYQSKDEKKKVEEERVASKLLIIPYLQLTIKGKEMETSVIYFH